MSIIYVKMNEPTYNYYYKRKNTNEEVHVGTQLLAMLVELEQDKVKRAYQILRDSDYNANPFALISKSMMALAVAIDKWYEGGEPTGDWFKFVRTCAEGMIDFIIEKEERPCDREIDQIMMEVNDKY